MDSKDLNKDESMPKLEDILTETDSAGEETAEALSFDDIWSEDFLKELGLTVDSDRLPEEEASTGETPAEKTSVSISEVYSDDPKAHTEPELQTEPEVQEPDAQKRGRKEQASWQKSLLMYVHDLVYLLAVVIFVFLMLFRVVVVSGDSMNNTLYNGDYLLLISNAFYRNPQVGDIIVASKDSFKNGAPIVKRVIATEGQTVYIDFKEGIIYVDGDPIEEDYIIGNTTMDEGVKFPLTVDPGCVFVMGDNREDSKDSRDPEIGQIDTREIMGKVVFLFIPGQDHYDERDFGRIGAVS